MKLDSLTAGVSRRDARLNATETVDRDGRAPLYQLNGYG